MFVANPIDSRDGHARLHADQFEEARLRRRNDWIDQVGRGSSGPRPVWALWGPHCHSVHDISDVRASIDLLHSPVRTELPNHPGNGPVGDESHHISQQD